MKTRQIIIAAATALLLLGGWSVMSGQDTARAGQGDTAAAPKLETATFGGGCFWCLEAVFEELKGVKGVVSGFAGGRTDHPSYQEVCTGRTGHAEVVQITYDPAVISYADLLGVFFSVHDPTTLNRQGADTGTQYRSIILYHDAAQQALAEKAIAAINEAHVWKNKVVTEVVPFREFFRADDHHQNYYDNNKNQGYCQVVINPKLAKFRKEFAAKLKETS